MILTSFAPKETSTASDLSDVGRPSPSYFASRAASILCWGLISTEAVKKQIKCHGLSISTHININERTVYLFSQHAVCRVNTRNCLGIIEESNILAGWNNSWFWNFQLFSSKSHVLKNSPSLSLVQFFFLILLWVFLLTRSYVPPSTRGDWLKRPSILFLVVVF